MSCWKLSVADSGSVTGASAYSRKVMAMSRLEGQMLTEAKVDLE